MEHWAKMGQGILHQCSLFPFNCKQRTCTLEKMFFYSLVIFVYKNTYQCYVDLQSWYLENTFSFNDK